MRKKFLLFVLFLSLCFMPNVVRAGTNATALMNCLATEETICTLAGNVVLEEDIAIHGDKRVIANNYTIDLNGYELEVVGALEIRDVNNIIAEDNGSSLVFSHTASSYIGLLNEDYSALTGFYIVSDLYLQAASGFDLDVDDIPVVYVVGQADPSDNTFVSLITENNKINYVLDNAFLGIQTDMTFTDEKIIANGDSRIFIGEGVSITNETDFNASLTLRKDSTFTNESDNFNPKSIELYGASTFTNNADIEGIIYVYEEKEATFTNTGNITFSDDFDAEFIGTVNNTGTMVVDNPTEDFWFGTQKAFNGNQLVINHLNLLDYNSRLIIDDKADGTYNIYKGFLIYLYDEYIYGHYASRKNNVTNISILAGDSDFYIESVFNENNSDDILKIEILETTGFEVDGLTKGAIIYNNDCYDDYEIIDGTTILTKYIFTEIDVTNDETDNITIENPGYLKLKYTYKDGVTEILNFGFVYSEDDTDILVAYESNDGSYVLPQVVANGGTARKPANPTKDNYLFGDWYTDKELTQKYDFTTVLTDDIVLYASWTINPNTFDGGITTYIIVGLLSLIAISLIAVKIKKQKSM